MPGQPRDAFSHIPHDELRNRYDRRRNQRGGANSPARVATLSLAIFSASFLGSLNYPQSALAADLPAFLAEGRTIAASAAASATRSIERSGQVLSRLPQIAPRLSVDTRTLGARLEVAQAAAADTSGSFAGYLAALWDQLIHGNEVTATNTEPASPYIAPSTRIASSTIPRTSVASVAPVSTIITPVIERVVTQSAPVSSGVSASLLASSLQALRDDLLNRIAGISIPAPAAPSVPIQAFAASQRIDALSGTTLSNIIVKGVSGLTAGDIPALAYLATSGGTITGDLTISGALSAAALAVSSIASSGAIEAPYFTATSTTASTFPNLLATNGTTTSATSTTLYATSLVAGNATSTKLFSTLGHFTTGIIDTLTATVATLNSLTASNLTATNATTTNLAITGIGTSMLVSTDSTGRVIATSTPAAASFIATSSTASQFPYASSTAITVSGTASTTNLVASASFTLANLTGFLKATAGAVATSLVNLASDVTGILPVTNGGTGWAAITAGTIPYGNGTGAVATSSALTFDGTKLIASYASTTAITSSGSAYFATVGGNVGIGTTNPAAQLQLEGAGEIGAPAVGGNKSAAIFAIANAGPYGGNGGSLEFGGVSGKTFASVKGLLSDAANNTAGDLAFYTRNSDTDLAMTERMRITYSGAIGIGTISSTPNPGIWINPNGYEYLGNSGGLTGWGFLNFYHSGSLIGNVVQNGTSGVAYNTTSDRRLKENIATTTAGLATLLNIPVDDFNFISDPSKQRVQGFIAQELDKVYPEAVTTNGDNGTDPLGATSTPWSVDYGRVTPLIVKAVQELSADLSLLASRVSALEATVAGFAQSFTSKQITATQELCVADDAGKTCITRAQLDSMLAHPSTSASPPPTGDAGASTTPSVDPGTTTPPTIIIEGDNPATIHVGDTYADIGAIAKDSLGHGLSFRTFLNGVLSGDIVIDTSAAATDTIDYVATDTWGNTSTSTRTVIVEAAATASPATEPSTSTSTPPATVTAEVATSTATSTPSAQ